MRKLVLAGAILLAMGAAATVEAAAVLCPDASGFERYFSLEVTVGTGTASCYAWGTGNIEGNNSDFPGWTFIDKDSTTNEVDPNTPQSWFSATGIAGASSGGITINPLAWAAYTNILVAFKVGNNLNPSFAAFLLTPQVLSAIWSNTPEQGGGLSHVNFYGITNGTVPPRPPVPEPASMLLFGTGLIGVARVARKRYMARRAAQA